MLFQTADGQIVNIEKKRSTKSGFNATVKFSYNIKQTGSKLTQLNNSADIQYHKNAYRFIFLNNLSLLRYAGGDLVNDGFQHLRYNYTYKDSSILTLEVFAQHQYNENKLLKQRLLLGAGPRFRLIDKPNFSWYAAPLVMLEKETLSSDENSETSITRLDAYSTININIIEKISFNYISYFQPNLSNTEDYRFSLESGLSFKLSKYFAYNLSFAMDYDSIPPEGVENKFYYFKNQLVILL